MYLFEKTNWSYLKITNKFIVWMCAVIIAAAGSVYCWCCCVVVAACVSHWMHVYAHIIKWRRDHLLVLSIDITLPSRLNYNFECEMNSLASSTYTLTHARDTYRTRTQIEMRWCRFTFNALSNWIKCLMCVWAYVYIYFLYNLQHKMV